MLCPPWCFSPAQLLLWAARETEAGRGVRVVGPGAAAHCHAASLLQDV